MQWLLFAVFTLLFTVQSVIAHGYVGQIAVDGTWYAGNRPNNYKGPSPIRLVNDIGPVKGSDNPDLACGLGAQKAEIVAPANPGSTVSIQWVGGDGTSNWPHVVGPFMTYMASCGDTSCDQYDPTNAQWFKIDQYGKKPDGNTWYQADTANRDAYNIAIPQDLAPGGYLMRHEIIALHIATSVGGAEFYPMCIQLQVGGSGSGKPQSTVSFPGAYNDNDPGIYDPDVYNPGSNYTFPGGDISNLAASAQSMAPAPSAPPPFPSGTSVANAPAQPTQTQGQGGPPSSPTPPMTTAGSSPSSSAPEPEPTGAADSNGAGTGSCTLKARSDQGNQRRHFKRFMKRIMPHSSH